MADNYTECFNRVAAEEGCGGDSKWGLSLADLRGHMGNQNLKLKHLKDTTLEQVRDIMRVRYWDALNCDRIAERSLGLAYQAFDMAVEVGSERARKYLLRISSVSDPVLLIEMYFQCRVAHVSTFKKYGKRQAEMVRRAERSRNFAQMIERRRDAPAPTA